MISRALPNTPDRTGARNPARRERVQDVLLLIALVAFTLVNFAAGEAHQSARGWWIALILGVGFAKAIAIGWKYMMLNKAPTPLRIVFLAWAALFSVTLTTFSAL